MNTNTTDLAYVVRNRAGQIVVMFWGDPVVAEAEASQWLTRSGYTVEKAMVADAVTVDEAAEQASAS
jgi:hypothetical protein